MDYKIVFTEVAFADLESIVRFIARDNPAAAERFGDKLRECVFPLAQFPQLGRVMPEQDDENIREIVLGSYRIFYRTKHEQRLVEILRYWHAARGVPEIPDSDFS